MKRLSILFSLLAVALATGCDRHRTQTVTRTSVQGQTSLLDASAFDLGTITQIVKTSQIKDAAGLEQLVNGDSGINTVDLDKDGQIDFVAVRESQSQLGKLDFVAYPATWPEERATTIAQLTISQNTTTNQITISGGYPSYVNGYNDYHYHDTYHGPSLGQMLFLSYITRPGRVVYRHPYSYYRTRPIFTTRRRVYSRSNLGSRRSTYRTRVKISKPARVVKRPRTYTIQSAKKTKSRLATQRKARGNSLSGRSGTSRSYQKRNPNKAKARGSAFGGSSRTRTPTRKTTPKKSSWNSGSTRRKPTRRATPKRKSSWNSGSSRSRSRSRSRGRRRGRR